LRVLSAEGKMVRDEQINTQIDLAAAGFIKMEA